MNNVKRRRSDILRIQDDICRALVKYY